MQRHWLRERITDDCPRCGWHGYFHHYIATVGGDWATAVCDDCYADLHPGVTVAVRYFSARSPLDRTACRGHSPATPAATTTTPT
jgi:RNase P subunit RPR2